jgi:hypothetical protein
MRNRSRLYSFLLLFAAFVGFSGCEEDTTDNVSKVTTYADFTLTQGDIISIARGTAYAEPGVAAMEGSTSLPVTSTIQFSPLVVQGTTMTQAAYQTVTSVDTNNPGMYLITYAATNSDGFPATATRRVFVHPTAPNPAVDLSGNYRSGTSPASVVTKVADGVFFGTNIWGQGSTVKISGYIMSADGVTISVPQQDTETRIYGYGTRAANGNLNLKMSRPLFNPPLLEQTKDWVKQP